MKIKFNNYNLTAEDGFWIMFHFLKEHYDLTSGEITIGELLSLCEPIVDGEPADVSMIGYWNEALVKYFKNGKPEFKKI